MSQDKLIKKLHEIMSKSRRSLDDATLLYNKGSYDSSVSLAYYAAFHAIQALLLTKGMAFSKHTQVKGAFNKEFIHPGVFPRTFTEYIERLFKDRQVGDYEYGEQIKGDEAKKDISDAETLMKAIAKYLVERYNQEF